MDEKLVNKPIEKLLWLDLEMTGLSASEDLIMEVAAIITDWDFNELAIYQGVIRNDDLRLQERLSLNALFWDANPEPKAVLIEQNEHGKPLPEVEDELLAFLDEHLGSDRPTLLAGNSIHIDRRFIVAQWPRFDARLHYRMLDVSAWKVVFENKYKQQFAKPETHRALEDIRGSISELKYYLQKLQI